jgi:glycogenin glucosyltransferase
MSSYAFVTLLTSDDYLAGALVLVHSLLDVHGTRQHGDDTFQTVCIVTPATVSVESIKTLRAAFDLVVGVDEISSASPAQLDTLGAFVSSCCTRVASGGTL